MSEQDSGDLTDMSQEEVEKVQRKPAEEGGVPNKESGAGMGAGKASSFEGEEDSDTPEGV
jgi:hypothetical protein